MKINYVHPITIRSFFFPRNPFLLTDFLGFRDRMATVCMENLNNDRDSGKIKVQKYLENTIKNEVLANFSCPSLKESLM